MIKKIVYILPVLVLMSFSVKDTYRDGVYCGSSNSIYSDEPFYGFTKIVIENGKMTKVDFCIRDSSKHEYFDDQYEKYYTGFDLYIQQCRNDWKGVQTYPGRLLKSQDIDKVDAVSGATWSYNLFKASVKKALTEVKNTK
jgi:major membrane immunogen (membrane-anchored lipoprotein)